LDTKVGIYRSAVRPIRTYSVETRDDTSKTKQLSEITKMNTLRKAVGKTRLDHVTNEDKKKGKDIPVTGRGGP
jgi:hypothetical protein